MTAKVLISYVLIDYYNLKHRGQEMPKRGGQIAFNLVLRLSLLNGNVSLSIE